VRFGANAGGVPLVKTEAGATASSRTVSPMSNFMSTWLLGEGAPKT